MTTQRPKIGTPEWAHSKAVLHKHLFNATLAIGDELKGASGCSVVLSSIGHWLEELAELDPAETASYFRALATIADPTSTPSQKETAERYRRSSFERLCEMACAEGDQWGRA